MVIFQIVIGFVIVILKIAIINVGKGENIWDHLTHSTPQQIADRSNGDVAANSYELYMEDIKALKLTGVSTKISENERSS